MCRLERSRGEAGPSLGEGAADSVLSLPLPFVFAMSLLDIVPEFRSSVVARLEPKRVVSAVECLCQLAGLQVAPRCVDVFRGLAIRSH